MKVLLLFSFVVITLLGCDRAPDEPVPVAAVTEMTVYKSPTCGCCAEWVDHIEKEGFLASVEHPQNLNAVKETLGLKREHYSCHTGVTENGYVFEGHIPAKTISAFLQQPPKDALGLAVPGMPLGSPGMEMDDRFTPYSVLLVKKDGSTEVYRRFESAAEQY